MIIANNVVANKFVSNQALNPSFFGLAAGQGGTKRIVVIPDPITLPPVPVPSKMVDGVMVNFPAFQPPAYQPPGVGVDVPVPGGGKKNLYEAVGVVVKGGIPRNVCLIRPNLVAGAKHYNPPKFSSYLGLTVRFFAADGRTEDATIRAVAYTSGDFECYFLDRNISVVQPAPLATEIPQAGAQLITFGLVGDRANPYALETQAAPTVVKYAFTDAMQGGTTVATLSNKATASAVMQPGDSGSPSFFVDNGVPRFVGTTASIEPAQWNINIVGKKEADAINSL